MLTREQLKPLRDALQRTDKETQAFLQPLLPMTAVQDVLLSFACDTSRSFEDWVWDSAVQQRFKLLREQAVSSPAKEQGYDVDYWFAKASNDQQKTEFQQLFATEPSLLDVMETAQEDGKRKFKRNDFYAAHNAFQKSLDTLKRFQQEQQGSPVDEIGRWPADLQDRYVTLCCNLAVCGIREDNVSVIKEHANMALAVDTTNRKAFHALAKAHLMEEHFEDAYRVVETALESHPDERAFLTLRSSVQAAERKLERRQADLALAKEKRQKELEAKMLEDAKEQQKRKEQRELRDKERAKTPLPTREDDQMAANRLHVYFMRVKHQLAVDIKSKYNPDNGELPLFECDLVNTTTGEQLASGIRAASKKAAKNEAAKVAIEVMWEQKIAEGSLMPEDKLYLERYEQAKRDGVSIETLMRADQASAAISGSRPEGGNVFAEPLPVRLSHFESQINPVQLVNQLHTQKKLKIVFELEDMAKDNTTEFVCTAFLNDEKVAETRALSKKKARADAAAQTLDQAVERGLLVFAKDVEYKRSD